VWGFERVFGGCAGILIYLSIYSAMQLIGDRRVEEDEDRSSMKSAQGRKTLSSVLGKS